MRWIVTALLLASASCVAPTETAPDTDAPSSAEMVLTGEERAACEATGGYVERAGLLGAERCTRRFSDAGKTCKDSDECEGQCRAGPKTEAKGHLRLATGVCQANDNPFGCFTNVENGTLGPGLCVD